MMERETHMRPRGTCEFVRREDREVALALDVEFDLGRLPLAADKGKDAERSKREQKGPTA